MNNPSYTIRYPMAINTQGQLISAVLAPSRQEYTCIDCASRMVVKKGEKVRHHFAHFADTNITRACSPESAIHKAGKRILREKISHALIANTPVYFAWKCSSCGRDAQVNIIHYCNWVAEEISLPQSLIRPDLTLYKDKSPKLAIEIVKSNYPSEDKVNYFTEINLASFIIEVAPEDDLMSKWQDNIIKGYFATPTAPIKFDLSGFRSSIPKAFPFCSKCYYDLVNTIRTNNQQAKREARLKLEQEAKEKQAQEQLRKNIDKIKDRAYDEAGDIYAGQDISIWEIEGLGVVASCYYSDSDSPSEIIEVFPVHKWEPKDIFQWVINPQRWQFKGSRDYFTSDLEIVSERHTFLLNPVTHTNLEEFIKYHLQSTSPAIRQKFSQVWNMYEQNIIGKQAEAHYSMQDMLEWLANNRSAEILEIPPYGILHNLKEQKNEEGLWIVDVLPPLHRLPGNILEEILDNDIDWDELYDYEDDENDTDIYIKSQYFHDMSPGNAIRARTYPSMQALMIHRSIVDKDNYRVYSEFLKGNYYYVEQKETEEEPNNDKDYSGYYPDPPEENYTQTEHNLKLITGNYKAIQNPNDEDVQVWEQQDSPKVWEIPGLGVITNYHNDGDETYFYEGLDIAKIYGAKPDIIQTWLETGKVDADSYESKYEMQYLSEFALIPELRIHDNREEFIKYHANSPETKIKEKFTKVWSYYQQTIKGSPSSYSVEGFENWDTDSQAILEIDGYGIFTGISEQWNEPGLAIIEYLSPLHTWSNEHLYYLLEQDEDFVIEDEDYLDSYKVSEYFHSISANYKTIAVNIYPNIQAFITHKAIVDTEHHKFYTGCLNRDYADVSDGDGYDPVFAYNWQHSYSKENS